MKRPAVDVMQACIYYTQRSTHIQSDGAKKRLKHPWASLPLPDNIDRPHAHVSRHLDHSRPNLFDFNRGGGSKGRQAGEAF